MARKKLYVKWKGYDDSYNSQIVRMSEYFPESKFSGGRVKVESDLSNYATKSNVKICNKC